MVCYTKYSNSRILNSSLYILALFIFFGTAFRTSGPDLVTYKLLYQSPERIPDIFFQILFVIFNKINLPFQVALLLIMSVTVIALKRITHAYNISFLFIFCIYFIYLFPIRELAQFRIGMAISLFLIAFSLNQKRFPSWFFYIISVLCHYTVIVLLLSLVGSYMIASFKSKKLRVLIFCLAAMLISGVGMSIDKLLFIDPRMGIYLTDFQHEDGRPVQSFFVIIYYTIITLSFNFFVRDEVSIRDKKAFTYMLIFSILVFFAFSSVAIFAYRLAHVVAAFHPIMLAITFKAIKNQPQFGKKRTMGSLFIALIMLIYVSKLNVGSIIYDIQF